MLAGRYPHARDRLKRGLWRIHRAWFRYGFPLVFLVSGLNRRSSGTGDIFLTIAGLLTLRSCLPGASEPSTWRCVHILLTVATAIFAVTAISLQVVCQLQGLGARLRHVVAWLRLAGLTDSGCSTAFGSAPEVACFVASLVSWLLALLGEGPTLAPQRALRALAMATLLVACSTLDFNAFAAIYHCFAVLLALRLASPRSLYDVAGARWLQSLLSVLALVHVLVVLCLASSVAAPPTHFRALLGAKETRAGAVQVVLAYSMAQLLLWCTPIPAEGPSRVNQRSAPATYPLLRGSTGDVSMDDGGGVSASGVELEMSPAVFAGGIAVASAGVAEVRPQWRRASTLPTTSAERRSTSTRGSTSSRQPRRCLPPWVAEVLLQIGQGPLLPVASLLLWTVQWPSLVTLPALAGALLFMVLPIQGSTRHLLFVSQIYLSLYAVVLYGYNVYLTCFHPDAVTAVPGQFTWLERLGLQSAFHVGRNPTLCQVRFVLSQSIGLAVLGTSCRCARAPPPTASAASNPYCEALVRWTVWLGRPGAIGLALFAALGGEASDLSLVGFGFLLWTLLLAMTGYAAGVADSGWDAFRANAGTWWSLFLWSALAACSLQTWEVIGTRDLELIGLRRETSAFKVTLLPLSAAVLAALQIRAFRCHIRAPKPMIESTSLLAQFLASFGMFAPLVLMFVAVMLPPVSMYAFVLLLLFVAMAAVEQFGLRTLRRAVLVATGVVSAVQLPVRYLCMLPAFYNWIAKVAPKEEYQFLWDSLALDEEDLTDACRKLILVAILMLFSSCLCRGFEIWESPSEHLPMEASTSGPRLMASSPLLAAVLRRCGAWSEPLMIFVSFFFLQHPDLLTRLQLLALTAMLVSCRGWSYVGGLVSVTAMASLLVQYFLRFQFIKFSHQEYVHWLGLAWEGRVVGLEIVRAALGITQHAVQRVAFHCEEAAAPTPRSRKELVAHSALIGATLLLLTTVFSADSYSIVSVCFAATFLASGDAGRLLSAEAANRWLRRMCAVLLLSLLVSWTLLSWLSPPLHTSPTAEDISKWPVCLPFDALHLVDSMGAACAGSHCQTQRTRCGTAWISWLRLPGIARGHCTVEFLALFSICLLRRVCMAQKDSPASSETTGSLNQAGSLSSASPSQGQEEGESASEDSQLPHICGFALKPVRLYTLCTAAVWLALAGSAILQKQANVIAVVYLLLLFSGLSGGTAETKPATLKSVRVFNMLVMVVWALYQCPSLPCPFLMQIDDAGPTGFLSPWQCLALEHTPQLASIGAGRERVTSVVLQSVGLRKETGGLYFSWPNVFNIALFFCASLLATMSARWERELATQFEEDARELQERAASYVQYVQRWRSHELQQVATKHWVLRAKLDDLMRHLDRLRAFWVDQTSTLSLRAQRSNKADSETANSTKEVQPEVSEELHRAWRVRLLDLCLQTGWSQEEIEPVFRKFAEEVGVCDELGLEKAAEATIQLLETSVVSLMRTRELQVLRRITEEEVQNREAELLERLRQHARGQIAIPVPNEVTSSSEEDTSSPGQEQPVQEQPLHAKAAEPEKVDPETNPAPASATLSSEAVPRPVDAEHPPAPAQPSQAVNTVEQAQELVQRTRPLLEAVIDDLLFYRVGDDTLQAHRKENTWWVLLGKACWSQTFCLLVAAAILQFASYRSVLAFGTMFTIVISRIFFPHAPPKLWRFLQIYNIVTITLKMIYQTPIFCADGSLDFRGCPFPQEMLIESSWASIIGLLKVDAAGGTSKLTVDTLQEALQMDVLVGVVLFFHCHVLSQGGRLYSTNDICRQLEEGDSPPPDEGAADTSPDVEVTEPATTREASRFSLVSASAEDWRLGAWLQEKWSVARDQVVSSATLRKPAYDFYIYRFVLLLGCFCLLLLFWNSLAGTGRSFTAALSSNIFSGTQVIAIIALLACMIADRALYTWYTRDRVLAEGPRAQEAPEAASRSATGPDEDGAISTGSRISRRRIQSRGLPMLTVLQMLLLLSQLIALHAILISAWAVCPSTSAAQASMLQNFTLLCFYVFYVVYLILSALQLSYDVHIVRGGLGLTHSVDMVPWLLFKVYTTVPFLEELRVLTDWTVTETSMNLFMWFKLEDAQQNLYKVRCDMNARKYVKPYAKRPIHEKVLQGGLFLLALFVLIVGPVTYFSTANLFLKSNLVYTGSLKASLEVEVAGGGISQLPLYDSAQADISLASSEVARQFAISNPSVGNGVDLNLQIVKFPKSADNLWLVSNSLRYQVAKQLSDNQTKANLVIAYQFQGNLTTPGRGLGRTPPVALSSEQVQTLAEALQNTSFEGEASIDVPCGLQTQLLVDSSGQVAAMGTHSSLSLTLSSEAGSVLPSWSMAGGCKPCPSLAARLQGVEEAAVEACPVSFQVASEKVAPTPVGSESSSASYSIMGIYLGVVYTIGRFLRLVFQDASKRVIYEEMNDTELLQDLCNGIYISRITGNLRMEYRFYYELLRIFRSPELLLDISKPKVDTGHFPAASPGWSGQLTDDVPRSFLNSEPSTGLLRRPRPGGAGETREQD